MNDYKRLSVGDFLTGVTSGFTWTPAFISYGDNNRTQMFRVPEPGASSAVSSRLVNPYLGMAAFIAAGLDGIRRRLDPGEPNTRKNMYRLTLDDVKGGKIGLIPRAWPRPSTAFEARSGHPAGARAGAGRGVRQGEAAGMGAVPQHGEPLGDRPLPHPVLTGSFSATVARRPAGSSKPG